MYDGELAPALAGRLNASPLRIAALARKATHDFAKTPCDELNLVKGLGVEGDAHFGALDRHLFLDKPNAPPNLRQLHIFPGELMDVLQCEGFAIAPGAIGENMVSRGVDVLDLPLDTVLRFPSGAEARLTGRRTPCRLVDRLGKGLMRRLKGEGGWGERPIAGVMAVIAAGGPVRVGEAAAVIRPAGPWVSLPAL